MMIGTAVVVGGVLFAIMQMGSAPKPLSDEELAGPAPKKKQKKAAPAPAPAEKKKKKKKVSAKIQPVVYFVSLHVLIGAERRQHSLFRSP